MTLRQLIRLLIETSDTSLDHDVALLNANDSRESTEIDPQAMAFNVQGLRVDEESPTLFIMYDGQILTSDNIYEEDDEEVIT